MWPGGTSFATTYRMETAGDSGRTAVRAQLTGKGGRAMVPSIQLKFKNSPHGHAEYSFSERRVCLIGRGPDCDLQLPSEEDYMVVSRHHCRLEIDPPHVRVRDLGSRNGTRINGMQIGHPDKWSSPRPKVLMEYELHNGDEL